MKHFMLIHQNITRADVRAMPGDEQRELAAAWQAVREAPGVTPGFGLQPPETATTVRVQDGRVLTTDGPFAELEEGIAGSFVFEGEDLDAAIELASRIPAARRGGAVEVRPLAEW